MGNVGRTFFLLAATVSLFVLACSPTEVSGVDAIEADLGWDGGLIDGDWEGSDAGLDLADGADDAGAVAPVAVDRLLLDNEIVERLNFEISPNQRWATLNERPRGSRALSPVLYEIQVTGELRRVCAYPEASLRTNASMQFGEADGQSFAVGLRADGAALIVIRPDPDPDPDCPSLIEEVPLRGLPEDVPPTELLNPYPVRGFDGRAWVALHRHAPSLDLESVYVQELAGQEDIHLAWTDTRPNRFRGFGTFATVARWFTGEARFIAGRWREGSIQVFETTLSETGAATTRQLTMNPGNKADAFPFRTSGGVYILTNDGGGPDGLLYEEDEQGAFVPALAIPFDASQSAIAGTPSSALSFETFVWGDQLYASYQIADVEDRAPECRGVNCTWNELWIAAFSQDEQGRIDGLRSRCRVSAATSDPRFRSKVDPEPAVVEGALYIFHQRSDLTRMPGNPGNQLAVIEIHNRVAFDRACARGTAAPD